MVEAVGELEPAWGAPMAAAVELGWEGRADPGLARDLLHGWAEELTVRGTELEREAGRLDP